MSILLSAGALWSSECQVAIDVESLIAQKCLLCFLLGFVVLEIFSLVILREQGARAPLLGGGVRPSHVACCSSSCAAGLKPLLDLLPPEGRDVQGE
jgi:hypothetical protein